MDTIPGQPRPLDEASLFWWSTTPQYKQQIQEEEETGDILLKWQQFNPEWVDCPTEITHVGDSITKNEVMMMYKCSTSILETIDNFKTMVNRRKGNFPMPGWHKWMIGSGFLSDCQKKWGAEAALTIPTFESCFYHEWRELIYLPRPGFMQRAYSDMAVSKRIPEIRITDEDGMEEEDSDEDCERPKKLKK